MIAADVLVDPNSISEFSHHISERPSQSRVIRSLVGLQNALTPSGASHLGTTRLTGGIDMNTLRQLRNFWILGVATMVLTCFSTAVAQASYKVQDLGVQHPDNLGMAMGLNNHGWTLNMEQLLDPFSISLSAHLVQGTDSISIGELKLELGTLGGPNSSINWNGINDPGEAVGMSETSVPDPNGEDVCGFGTHLTCLPFLWQNGLMSALPTVGGNNGQASAINNRGQVAGYAENGTADSTCPPGTENFMIDLPVVWTKGKAQALPTIGSDPDGVAYGINNQGQAVGYSGTCTAANYAVVWENGAATSLPDLGDPGAIAYAINSHGQIVGQAVNSDGIPLAALWQDNTVTSLGPLLPGDVASFATSINNRGQAVGSSFNSNNGASWSRGLIWQNGVTIDLNTLFPASSHLFVISASNINESGQIAGMAVDTTGPHAGNIVHAFLATPVNEDMGKSIADVVRTHPEINLPAAIVGKQLSPRSAHCSIHDQGIF
jgi:probable HAF family extracellular repeat protein